MSTALAILEGLREIGIEPVVEGDLIRLVGGAGKLDAFELERVKAHKPELMRLLQARAVIREARQCSTTTVGHESNAMFTAWEPLAHPPAVESLGTLNAGELAGWLSRAPIPATPLRLSRCEVVTDAKQFVVAHLATLRANPGLREPYLAAAMARVRRYLERIGGR